MTHDRYGNSTLSDLQKANSNPIYGYQHLPVLSLEEATEEIIQLAPGVVGYVSEAKKECNRNSTLLTNDESAAIYLYSMPISFFPRLNEALRAENRHALKPWFAFLKLFINALKKLPSTKGTVWRGVKGDVGSIFNDGDVHIWWSVTSCSSNLTVVEKFLGESGTVFAIDAIHGKDISAFSAFPDEQEIVLMPGTPVSANSLPLNFKSHLFIIHLKEENEQSESESEPRYLFELMKQAYQQNSRIERIMNPSKSFPMKQSYINLAIVETKEQQEKEKKLLTAKLTNEIISTYEEIYGTKTKIEIKNIFEKCKDPTKKILVFGRAGIGKTTFCGYVAYQWATGAIWQQYQLVVFIRLRNLTESRYPILASSIRYSLFDLVKTEYFQNDLSKEYESLLKEELNKSQTLWLLDGYDEIVQNIPAHLQYLLEQLLNTPHHILTSRPYLNTLSYNLRLEITGFIDDNIKEYVEQFFDLIKDEIDNASLQAQKLLSFLKCNPRIWGIVHIPVNLELICSLWCDTDWSETTTLTMTTVYDKMTEWQCRRHLEKQNISSSEMTKEDVYIHFHKELAFLENLAFNGMKSKNIILPPKLLRTASKESECSLQNQSHLLNIGILKSLDYKPIGTHIEADKNHYFVHLSFQEHFAARYLVNALNGIPDQQTKAIDFIKTNKYNQRFELVFTFASGLLIDYNIDKCMNLFWDTLSGEPLDLIGIRHVQIVISCLEEADCITSIPHYRQSMDSIIKWINYSLLPENYQLSHHLLISLRRSPSLLNQPQILDTFVKLYTDKELCIKERVYFFISDLPISNPHPSVIQLHITAVTDGDPTVRRIAYRALREMGEKAAINEVINRLTIQLGDADWHVRNYALEALSKMGEKAATNEVINRLLILLGDTNCHVKRTAWEVLGKMGEKAATNEVINRLLILLSDSNPDVKISACEALGKIGEKAATIEVINRLLILLGDTNLYVGSSAWEALDKMGEKVATNEVINRLLILLGDSNPDVKISACETLTKMGEKSAINEVINRLLILLDDTNWHVKRTAWEVLGKMGEKAATNEVINRLLILLGDTNWYVRRSACEALGKIGEKAATIEVINRLLILLGDTNWQVRSRAWEALDKMGEEVATNEVINRLLILLSDSNPDVKISACETLGKMGEKSAINEVINRLLILLDDTNWHMKRTAWEVLGKMGEKAATNEVINRLLILLGDTNWHVRSSAWETLDKMGEKVATNEVINRLLILLSDSNPDVKISACETLGKMGAKAATSEVINRLTIQLGDTDCCVRKSACEALGKIGEKAVTIEVIDRLIILLGDTDWDVRRTACEALGKIGEKAATNEVINRLLILLGDTNWDVRRSACKALGKRGEKAATNEVINRLLILLDDTELDVRRSAWEALDKMGEKVATNEVINRLLILLGDTELDVRRSAWEALDKMGEKVATNEVINRLLILLDDTNCHVKRTAWEVLSKMGEKVATCEMIDRLLILLGDTDWDVRRSASEAVGKMGEKAATNEVINRLLILLSDSNPDAKISALEALGKMGGKAATNEVINRLLILLGDTNWHVRRSACEALGKMGEKAATDEVIGVLLGVYEHRNFGMSFDVCIILGRILDLLASLSDLKSDTVRKLSQCILERDLRFQISFSAEKLIKGFLETSISFWLPIIKVVFSRKGYALTVNGMAITVESNKELVELRAENMELGQQLQQYLINWLDRSLENGE